MYLNILDPYYMEIVGYPCMYFLTNEHQNYKMGVVMCRQPEKTTSVFDEWISRQVNSV